MSIELESLESEEWPLVDRRLGASLLNVVDIKWLKESSSIKTSSSRAGSSMVEFHAQYSISNDV